MTTLGWVLVAAGGFLVWQRMRAEEAPSIPPTQSDRLAMTHHAELQLDDLPIRRDAITMVDETAAPQTAAAPVGQTGARPVGTAASPSTVIR